MSAALVPGPKVCKRCGQAGHDGRRHRGHQADGKAPGVPRLPSDPPRARAAKKPPKERGGPRVCGVCGGTGHDRRFCPDVGVTKKVASSAGSFPSQEEVAMRPRVVNAGDRFIVTDDVQEDERPSVWWLVDEVWIAIAPTGDTAEGFDEWQLRREGGMDLRTGFPQLTPLMPCPSTGGRA